MVLSVGVQRLRLPGLTGLLVQSKMLLHLLPESAKDAWLNGCRCFRLMACLAQLPSCRALNGLVADAKAYVSCQYIFKLPPSHGEKQ